MYREKLVLSLPMLTACDDHDKVNLYSQFLPIYASLQSIYICVIHCVTYTFIYPTDKLHRFQDLIGNGIESPDK